jgi:hypothetical protein
MSQQRMHAHTAEAKPKAAVLGRGQHAAPATAAQGLPAGVLTARSC